FLAFFVFFELIVIILLGKSLYEKRNNVLGASVVVEPLNKDDLIFANQEDLEHFFEPKPNRTIVPKNPLLHYHLESQTINADSLNERYNYAIEKAPDTFRIITLGDSYTYGLYMQTKDNYPEKLEDMLQKLQCKGIKKFEVINLGFGGYDIQYEVKRFEKRGEKYNPDLVLWFLKNDDFGQIAEVMNKKLAAYKKEMIESEDMDEYYKEGKFTPWGGKVTKELLQSFGEKQLLDYQKNALHKIDTYYKRKLLIFSFSSLKKQYKNVIEDFVKSRSDSYFYDNLVDIYSMGESLPNDKHPTAAGYALIAE